MFVWDESLWYLAITYIGHRLPAHCCYNLCRRYYTVYMLLLIIASSYLIVDEALQPYIQQIDDIETAVNALEQSAYKIDAYSKKLGMFYELSFLA